LKILLTVLFKTSPPPDSHQGSPKPACRQIGRGGLKSFFGKDSKKILSFYPDNNEKYLSAFFVLITQQCCK